MCAFVATRAEYQTPLRTDVSKKYGAMFMMRARAAQQVFAASTGSPCGRRFGILCSCICRGTNEGTQESQGLAAPQQMLPGLHL